MMKSCETNSSNETTKGNADQNSTEELLGSTYNNVEGSDSKSQQLRTSARVFKKMKLDSAVAVTNPIAQDKKGRIFFPRELNLNVTSSEVKEDVKPEVKRPLRPSWSQEDKNLFFEALNEFGKDFEAIHSYISSKLRKKGLPDSVMKTKDQIRHFYYRTWHKISKHLKFSDDVKKIAQELYGLVNYGELRKKVGSVSEKTCMKLNELIYRGAVAIRIKGKTIRVKTPMCRALRKLNQLDEKHDDLKLPTRINVELVPKDMNTWLTVQSLAQNPRIKAYLPLQKRLSTLIKFLNCKWKSLNLIAYEDLNATITECQLDKKPEDTKAAFSPCLRVSPASSTHVEFPSVNLGEYFTNHSICLNAFEERIGVKTPGEQLCVIKGGTKKGGTKRPRNESTSEKTSPTNKTPTSVANIDNNENCISDADHPSVDDVVDEAINSFLALHQNQDAVDSSEEKNEDNEDVKEDMKGSCVNTVKNGWTSYNCGTLTIGELYLMFGSNSNLILEYSWDEMEPLKAEKICDSDSKEAGTESTNKENGVVNKTDDGSNVTGTLQRLLSIAKLYYRKNIVHCPCGHVCDGTKNSIHEKDTDLIQESVEKKIAAVEKKLPVLTPAPVVTTSVVPIIIQTPVHQFTSGSIFRRPVSPNIESIRAQLDSIQRLKPRYCNRRGRRPRSKQVVVERRLPLLPNKIDNGRQIVQMNIIPHEDISPQPRIIAPKIVNVNDKVEHNINSAVNLVPTLHEPLHEPITNACLNTEPPGFNTGLVVQSAEPELANVDGNISLGMELTDNAVTPSRVGSPTSISNLLDLALDSHNDNMLNNPVLESKDDTGIPSFVGLLSSHGLTDTTPPTSPSRILKENDNQWLNSEVADFSLSSFLGHLESPMKPAQSSTSAAPDDNHLSQDVDAHLQSLLTESSVDYMAKFADLAAQVVSDVKK